MEQDKRRKKLYKLRRKYVNFKKHKHPNANFKDLWDEAYDKYPD